MNRTTIAIRLETRGRIAAGAKSESQTIDGFLCTLLDEHEQNRFWGSFSDLTPEKYASALAEDGDPVPNQADDYALEDIAIDAEELG